MKLSIDLVPESSWYTNMRSKLSREEWDLIRRQAYARSGNHCEVCGATGRLHCHEVWEYDDNACVQRLQGLVALCELCHHVKHIGHAGIMANRGELDYEVVVKHFMLVNQCSRQDFFNHRREAVDQWRRRSQKEWKVDLGEYVPMVRTK